MSGLIPSNGILFAQTTRTYYEWTRLRLLDQWWHWLVLLMLLVLLVGSVLAWYRRDTRGLPRATRILLATLRILSLLGILCYAFDMQKRTEQKLVQNSRFVILVDTSQSMGISDRDESSAEQSSAGETRIDQVVSAFRDADFFAPLREKHDVVVYRFDESSQPTEIATFPQIAQVTDTAENRPTNWTKAALEVRTLWLITGFLCAMALLAAIGHFTFFRRKVLQESAAWLLLVAGLSFLTALVVLGVTSLRHDGLMPWQGLGTNVESLAARLKAQHDKLLVSDTTSLEGVSPQTLPLDAQAPTIDWEQALELAGGSTRLGDVLISILQQNRGKPLAGIGVLTDGNSNRGVELQAVVPPLRDARIPIFPIGLGSDLPPESLRLVELEAPSRVFPGDEFKLTGYLQSYGMSQQRVQISLYSYPERADDPEVPQSPLTDEVLEEQIEVELIDGPVQSIPFRLIPNELGKRVYVLRVHQQGNEPNVSPPVAAKVQVVDRKSRVLLFAGGPGREYQFLRNMLHRDRDTAVDVYLQTIQAGEGVSQEADKVLTEFPRSPAELYEYDCVVAFDPNWTNLDREQLELLESWVAEKGGGLICVAGPVHTASWSEKRRATDELSIVRQLYPVTFHTTSVNQLRLGQYGNTSAWPISITPEGLTMPFFDVAENDANFSADSYPWNELKVFGYFPIREVKPAAAVYAYHSDPQSAIDDQFPPFLVGQFYGSGRVLYMDTGEIWRLRKYDEAYFDRFYTKLIRYASQGRLLRDSNRGLLLVDKDRAFRGDTIAVRANVIDEQFQPATGNQVEVTIRNPDRSTQILPLIKAPGDDSGTYAGQFAATRAGEYLLTLALPSATDPVVLEREVRVRLPNLEVENSQRNDADLRHLAQQTSGRYWIGIRTAMVPRNAGDVDDRNLPDAVQSVRRETYLPGTPDRNFQRRLMSWLIVWICSSLSLEWLIRRLNKLA